MRITEDKIHAPDLPAEVTWLNGSPTNIDNLLRKGPVLVEFWDFARVNSLRTLPYMEEWHRLYTPYDATVLGIHCPGFGFGADEDVVREAVRELGIERPILLDPSFIAWRDYGNKGWPARYLWAQGGELRYFHYGEGDYNECELALQDALREYGVGTVLPAPMEPLRAADVPGAEFPSQTADIALPSEAARLVLEGEWAEGTDWLEAREAGATATARCSNADAFAVLSGKGVDRPGVHSLNANEGAACVAAAESGLRLHAFQFTPAVTG